MTNLEDLHFSYNPFAGPIPSELGSLTHLTALSLEENELSGPIPAELARLANLETMNLSKNDLSGPIPPEFESLWWFYLGGNGFSGCIPEGLRRVRVGDLDELGIPYCE